VGVRKFAGVFHLGGIADHSQGVEAVRWVRRERDQQIDAGLWKMKGLQLGFG